MDDKEKALITAVKVAVAKYGISGTSTRIVGDVADVNDAYIYKYFKNKEDMFLKAYMNENGAIFKTILYEIDKVRSLPVSFVEKAKLSFEKVWNNMLKDSDRIIFCVNYYHSVYFKNAESYHNEQLKVLTDRLGKYFNNEIDCKQTMYSLCSIFYDSAYAVAIGREKNTAEYENGVLDTEMTILLSKLKK